MQLELGMTVWDTTPKPTPKLPPAKYSATQWRIVPLRETALPEKLPYCEHPEMCADYWRNIIAKADDYSGEQESLYVLHLNVRKRVTGYHLVAHGTLDTILGDPRSVFRAAIIANASCIVLMHNHPSGESSPSPADISFTRNIISAGRVLKIEVLDHIVMGHSDFSSLRKLNYFYQ
jgi:DNA repair protein RadC